MILLVNAREKEYQGGEINYSDVIKMAFPNTDLSKHKMTVSYTRNTKPPFKDHGILTPKNENIKVTKGMRFNATLTWNG